MRTVHVQDVLAGVAGEKCMRVEAYVLRGGQGNVGKCNGEC